MSSQLVLSLPTPISAPRRIVLTDAAAQAQADARLAILTPLLDYRINPARFAHLKLSDKTPVTSFSKMALYVCENAQPRVTRSTLFDWLRRFEADSWAGLADRPRKDKGTFRWIAQGAAQRELAELAVYAHLVEHLNKRMAWEIMCGRAKQLGVKPPSYDTVREMLENIPPAIKTLALKGRRKFDEIFAVQIRRGYQDMEAGEILVSDHAIHDVLVQNDLFDNKTLEHMRLRFTGLIDMRSRKFVAYAWSQEGSSRSITTCLRFYLDKYGIFRLLYVDNGRDYQKVGRGARGGGWDIKDMAPEVLGVIARLNAEIQYCQPFHPQAKLIERANNTLHQRFDRRFITYTGSTPEKRPDRCIAALNLHQKLLTQGHPEDSDLPLASEFIRAAALWIEGEYNQMAKDVPGMKGMTPNEAWDAYRWQKQQPPPDPHILAALLADRTTRIVHNSAVAIDKTRYVPADRASQEAMFGLSGSQIIIAYDALNLDQVAAIDEDGHIIAYLKPDTMLRHANDQETKDAIGASMADRRRSYRQTRDQLDELSRRVLSTGYTPQHEQMLTLGRLPIPIDQLVVHRPAKLSPDNNEPANDQVPGELTDTLTAILRRNRAAHD